MSDPTPQLATPRLVLTPLRVDDAVAMVRLLGDPELHTYTGGAPPTLQQLTKRYRSQVAGPTDDETWHNWILRDRDTGAAKGYVQATVSGTSADVAWVVGIEWQGHGYATEAATAMCNWLRQSGVAELTACIHSRHDASKGVALAVGLIETTETDDDGEVVWRWNATPVAS